jgi:hypothetical protein
MRKQPLKGKRRVKMDTDTLKSNRQSQNEAAERFFGMNPLPEYGKLAPREKEKTKNLADQTLGKANRGNRLLIRELHLRMQKALYG